MQPVVTLQHIPFLVLRTDSGERQLPLAAGNCWTLGRSEENNFVLPDRWISRNHAMLQCMDTGEFYLIDLGSRNGSFVNGRRVSIPVTLRNGDNLTFGQTELQFYSPSHDNPTYSPQRERESTATATLHTRNLISVLVVDIRNFTGLTRQLDEKVLSEVIGTWFRHAGEIIREHGSWVDKYIGDAIMAVWIHGEVIQAGEMMRIFHALNDLNKVTQGLLSLYPLPFPLRIGAGINTGYAMVGNTGSGDRPDYTALGDTVNAAFRLETSTKQIGLDVALGETTYQHICHSTASAARLFKPHTVTLKGYDEPTLAHACTFADVEELLHATEGIDAAKEP